MPPIKKVKPWQLFVLSEERQTYILGTTPRSSLIKFFTVGDSDEYIERLIKDNDPLDESGLLTTNELIEIIIQTQDKLKKSNLPMDGLGIPMGCGWELLKDVLEKLKSHKENEKCYLRSQTEIEEKKYIEKKDAENKAFWSESVPCDCCGQPGKLEGSPWGVPATLSLCKWHCFLLFFDSSIYTLILLVLGGFTFALASQYAIIIPIYLLLLMIKFIKLWQIL